MTCLRPLALFTCLAALVRGQELLWEVYSVVGVQHSNCFPYFGDFDQDGAADLLVYGWDRRLPYAWPFLRVLSGASGAVLAELYPTYDLGIPDAVADFDRDGYPDVAFFAGLSSIGVTMEVWSIVGKAPLLRIPGIVTGAYGGAICGDCDLNGDGWPELLYVDGAGTLFARDRFGGLVYSIPAVSLGISVRAIVAVGDLDGDGGDDYLLGAQEGLSGLGLGVVILMSGRTATPLRFHWGLQPFDVLNRDVRRAGDVDGDGVLDYAAGNFGGARGLIMIWSGATGGLLRYWTDQPKYLFGTFLAGQDVDLDGRPDITAVSGGYPNIPGQVSHNGRVRTLSSRDGQDLVHVASQQWTSGFALSYADLGVQPGNPYPVFVVMDDPVISTSPPGFYRIRAWRCSPVGTRFVGSGCTSTAEQPTIGIRRVDATPTDHSRLVLGSAPANAFAVCVAAPTSSSLAAPVPLDFLGLPGCNLLVPPAITELRLTGAAGMDRGYAAFDFPSAMVPTGGVQFAAQWVVLDPATLQHATTQRYEFRVQ